MVGTVYWIGSQTIAGMAWSTLSDRVTFNIGGSRFQTCKSTLQKYPDTKLARLTTDDIAYDHVNSEYFFDRNPVLFNYILDIYRYEEIHFGYGVCPAVVDRELAFWGFSYESVAQCCQLNMQAQDEKHAKSEFLDRIVAVNDHLKDYISLCKNSIRAKIWLLLEDPSSSIKASIWATFFMSTILISVIIQCGYSSPSFRHPIEPKFPNATTFPNPKVRLLATTAVYKPLTYIDDTCLLIFIAELVVRFALCPNKVNFFKSLFNWIDIVSTLSNLTLVMYAILNPDFWTNSHKFSVVYFLSAFSVFKVLRLLKFALWNNTGRYLILSLKMSFREIGLLLVLFGAGVMIFSNLIYFAEFHSTEEDFLTIPVGFWWAIVTMTTVGYGDKHPHSAWGYTVGASCAMAGLLCAALPIPIISNNFTMIYRHEKHKLMAAVIRDRRREGIDKGQGRRVTHPKDLKVTLYPASNSGFSHPTHEEKDPCLF